MASSLVAVLSNLALLSIKTQDWKQVEALCNDALLVDPSSSKVFFRRATFYRHEKRWEEAEGDYLRSIEHNPEERDVIMKAIEEMMVEKSKC